ncbi:MAG: hypothetical protein AAGA02_02295 [Bacteroidota bacterium]
MAKNKYAWTSWSSMQRYIEHKREYKDETRTRISEALGFEPNLQASIVAEIQTRGSLERFYKGEVTQEQLDKYISNAVRYIKGAIREHCPEQAHLINDTIEH